MNKTFKISFSIVVIFILVVLILIKNGGDAVAPVLSPSVMPTATPRPTLPPAPVQQSNNVTYTDSGFLPSTITIKKGQTVTWKNESSRQMWTASAVHPTHKAYPGSGIEICGTNTLIAIFDACKGYAPGESWEFRFDNVGTWKYHNHTTSSHTGTIMVE